MIIFIHHTTVAKEEERYLFTRSGGPLPKKCRSFSVYVSGDRDLDTRTWARFLYNAPNHQVLSPLFNRSEVIVLTVKQSDKQTDAAENIHLAPLCYTPVGKETNASIIRIKAN